MTDAPPTLIVHDAAALWPTIIARAQAIVEVVAGLAAMLLCAGGMLGMWAGRALWRRTVGPSWARGRLRARILARRRIRRSSGRTGPRAPLWAHTQPIDYEEAA